MARASKRFASFLPLLSALAMAYGCASYQQQVRRVSDTQYRISCETRLAECLVQVDTVCHEQSFDILEARDDRRRYGPKLGDAQSQSRRSSALIECRPGNPSLFGDDEEEQAKSNALPPRTATESIVEAPQAAASTRLCTPGSTQVCVGAAACQGGQVCRADGSGFEACDCGDRTMQGTPGAEETVAPASEGTQPNPAEALTTPPPVVKTPAATPPPSPATPPPPTVAPSTPSAGSAAKPPAAGNPY